MAAPTKRSLLVLVLVLLASWVVVSAVVLDSETDNVEPSTETESMEPDIETDGDTYDVGANPEITAVESLPDGGYLVGGHVLTDGDRDAVVLRLAPNRSLESVYTFGGDGDAGLSDLIQTSDGGFAFVGWRGEFHTSVGWIVNADANGDIISEREFGSSTQYADRMNALVATDNDTIAAVGRTSRGVSNGTGAVLYELNADGNVLLERVYRTGNNRSAKDIVQASNGEYLIVGTDDYQANSIPYQTDETPAAWFARVGTNGDLLWTTETQRGSRRGRVASDIVDAHGSGYVAVVVTAITSIGGGKGMALQRLDPQGEVVWTRDAEYTCSSGGSPLAEGTDGYALVRWICTDDSPKSDAIIERWTTQGDLAWNLTFSDADEQTLTAVTAQEDGTFVAAGTVDEQIWLQTVTATDRSNESNALTNGYT